MKTNYKKNLTLMTGFGIAAALLIGTAGGLNASQISTAKGGATRLLELSGRAVTKPEASSHKTMSCTKCRNDFVQRVDWAARGAHKPIVVVQRHLCEGCENELVVSGHGKAKTTTTVHKCNSCGADSLACCSTSTGAITAPKGMEKKSEVAPAK